MTQTVRTALEILAKARIDPIIAGELFEDALGGYWEEGIEKIKDELNVDDDEAELVWEHIRSVAIGRTVDLKEVTADEVEFTTVSERSGPGNPFVLWTSYFGRRGARVKPVQPTLSRDGVREFIFDGQTFPVEAINQIWKTVPKA
ncbi:hypothetical protein O9X98_14040 [Agrobacterium salinitolerans]|nr:hypothetical protein [Agrobacterium salinitolerans]